MSNTPRIWLDPASALHVLIGLEGGAGGVMGGGGVGGTYGDLPCGATGLTVVVGAVLDVADNALDMLTALLIVHFTYRPFGIPHLCAVFP